jgi:hypothetical protein
MRAIQRSGAGVRTHYVAIAVCAPLLIATPHSLVVTASRWPVTRRC